MHKYKTIKKLGEGSYGKVFLVELRDEGDINNVLKGISRNDKKKKKYYVLKKINLKKLSKKEKEFSFQELELLKYLKHPFMIRYKDAFLKNKILFLVMNFCPFGDLEEFIKKNYSRGSSSSKYYSTKEIFFMFYQLLLSLNYLHNQNIIHRDIKTQNVFLKSRLSIQLGDFGICKIVDKNKNYLTNTLIGTPFVMSPEQIISSEKYSFKSDCWSLGIVLFEMLFKKNPIEVFYKSKCTSINNLLNEIKNKRKRMILFNSSTFKNNKYIRSNKYFAFFLKKLCQKNKKKRWNTFDCLSYVFTKRFFRLNISFFYNKDLVERNQLSMLGSDDDDDVYKKSNLNFTLNQKNINFKNLKLQLIKNNLYFEIKEDSDPLVQEPSPEQKQQQQQRGKEIRNNVRPLDEITGDIWRIEHKNERLEEKLQKLNSYKKLVNHQPQPTKKNFEPQPQQPPKKRVAVVPVHHHHHHHHDNIVVVGENIHNNKNKYNNDYDYLKNKLPKKRKYNEKPKSLPNYPRRKGKRKVIKKRGRRKKSAPIHKKKVVRKGKRVERGVKKDQHHHHHHHNYNYENNKKPSSVVVAKKKKKVVSPSVPITAPPPVVVAVEKKKKKKKKRDRIIKAECSSDDDDEEGKVIMVDDSVTAGFSSSESSEEEGEDDDSEEEEVGDNGNNDSEEEDDDDDGDDDDSEDEVKSKSEDGSDNSNKKIFGSLEKRFLIQKKNCMDIFGRDLFQHIYDLYNNQGTVGSVNSSSNKFKKIKEILRGKDYLMEFVCLVEELCFIEKSL